VFSLAEDYERQENSCVAKGNHSDVAQMDCFIVGLRQSGSFALIHMRCVTDCGGRMFRVLLFIIKNPITALVSCIHYALGKSSSRFCK